MIIQSGTRCFTNSVLASGCRLSSQDSVSKPFSAVRVWLLLMPPSLLHKLPQRGPGTVPSILMPLAPKQGNKVCACMYVWHTQLLDKRLQRWKCDMIIACLLAGCRLASEEMMNWHGSIYILGVRSLISADAWQKKWRCIYRQSVY
jgi:hypothetical protein